MGRKTAHFFVSPTRIFIFFLKNAKNIPLMVEIFKNMCYTYLWYKGFCGEISARKRSQRQTKQK